MTRPTIIALLDAAATWLRTQSTNQWAKPGGPRRIAGPGSPCDLLAGKTWVVYDGAAPVGTFTADRKHDHQEIPVWPEYSLASRRRCRLTGTAVSETGSEHAGLLDWIGPGRPAALWRGSGSGLTYGAWYDNSLAITNGRDSSSTTIRWIAPSLRGALSEADGAIEPAEPALFHVEGPGELG